MATVELKPAARQELRASATFLERESVSLAADFVAAFEEARARLGEHPRLGPVAYRDLRRLMMRRFPHGVFYRYDADADHVVIVAVVDLRRDPDVWQRRT